MKPPIELIFEDITDEFGNPYIYYVLDYTFDLAQEVNHRADEPYINHPDAHTPIIWVVLQYPNNYELQHWMMSYLSESATRKSGKLTSYNEDGSILSEFIFKSAECMQMDQKGELEPGMRELTKTMTIRFSPKTLVIDGITVFGQLREERMAGVTPTVREGVSDTKKVTRYFLTNEAGEEIEEYKENDTIIVNIESRNRVGDTVSFSLGDADYDFEYKGEILPDDTLSNIVIGSDLEQIELKVVGPRQAGSNKETQQEQSDQKTNTKDMD